MSDETFTAMINGKQIELAASDLETAALAADVIAKSQVKPDVSVLVDKYNVKKK